MSDSLLALLKIMDEALKESTDTPSEPTETSADGDSKKENATSK